MLPPAKTQGVAREFTFVTGHITNKCYVHMALVSIFKAGCQKVKGRDEAINSRKDIKVQFSHNRRITCTE